MTEGLIKVTIGSSIANNWAEVALLILGFQVRFALCEPGVRFTVDCAIIKVPLARFAAAAAPQGFLYEAPDLAFYPAMRSRSEKEERS
jgi:hypothetical protein